MSDDDAQFIEVTGSMEVDGVPGLVQQLFKAIHQVLDTSVVILVCDNEYGIGAAGIALTRGDAPQVVARLRQTADVLEHEHLAQFN